MALKDDLMQIRGIGEAKADAVLEVLEESEGSSENIQEAIDHIKAGKPDYALKYLKREQ